MNPDDLVTRLDARVLEHLCATLAAKYPRVAWDAEQWRKVLDVVFDYAWPELRDRLTAAEAEVTRLDRARGKAAESCAAAEAERDELLAALREVASYLPAAVNRDSVDALLARMEGDR